MEISTNVIRGVLILTITGRMDSYFTKELGVATLNFPDTPIILDVTQVEYVNSSALRALHEFKRSLQVHGTPLILVEKSEGFTNKILEMSGFNRIFHVVPSVPEALQALSSENTEKNR